MATPTTTTRTSEPRPASQPTKDPRIDSPEIKVVYPSETKPPLPDMSDRGIVKPQTQPKLQTEPAQVKELASATSTSQPVTDQQTKTDTSAPTAKIPLWDAVKQNIAWCILIAVGLVVIGFFIGKKQAS